MSGPGDDTFIAATGAGYAVSAGGVRLRYHAYGDVAAADRPMILCLHGFPDDSRTWQPLLSTLAERFLVVTPDLRGYSDSDKPSGVASYTMDKLVGDVVALIKHFGREKVILLGHDWGAVIAQLAAVHHPQRVERLILLNMPHLNGLRRELATNARQQKASAYARLLQGELSLGPYDLDTLQRQLRDGGSRLRTLRTTLDVLRKSDLDCLLNYYRANYPRPPYRFDGRGSPRAIIAAPTLILFGLDDPYVLADTLRDNGRWFEQPLKVIPVPGAGHWVHHDAPDLVAGTILLWLGA